ncbi:MAG: hypothetical protein ACM31L_05460 [Actinomycetota bacterium]
MVGVVVDDLRRIVLALLFVVAFGWMAAHLLPGTHGDGWEQVAAQPVAGRALD